MPFVYLFLLILSLGAHAAEFSGTYNGVNRGAAIAVTIDQAQPRLYQGSIQIGPSVLLLTGQSRGEQLIGQLHSQGQVFYTFVAKVSGSNLSLVLSSGQSFVLARVNDQAKSKTRPSPDQARQVYVNRKKMPEKQLQKLENQFGAPIQSGRYWYDAKSGLWGVEGGPTAGLIPAGLALPGPIPADISGGATKIFFNDRELHAADRQGLLRLFGVANPGRYWLDAQGYLGLIGGPALVNLFSAVQAAQSQQGTISHGYKYGGTGSRGVLSGGMYSGFTSSGKSLTWYPGM